MRNTWVHSNEDHVDCSEKATMSIVLKDCGSLPL